MKNLISSIILLSIAAQGIAQSNFAAEFARRWMATRAMSIGVADAMPSDEYAFKPDPPSMDFGQQMTHIAVINYAFCAALKDENRPNLPNPTGKEAIVKLLGDSFDYCTKQINTVSNTQMNSTHSTPDGQLNGRELLLALYVHLAHHRGQAEAYLRVKGIKPPKYVF